MFLRIAAIAAYLAVIVAANWLTSRFGFTPVGFGLMATAGTYAAGLAFVARDAVQDAVGRIGALLALLAAGVLSWFLASPALAIASTVAFGLSELIDMAIYTPLRERGYLRAAVASNVVGSVVDTVVFLWLAGFAMTTLVVAGQLVGKAWATLAVVGAVIAARAVLRQRVRVART